MDNRPAGFEWPVSRLAEAVEQLARVSGLAVRSFAAGNLRKRRDGAGSDTVEGGLEHLSRALELETEASEVPYADVERALSTAGPALLKLTSGDTESLLVLIRSSGRYVRLLGVDGRPQAVPLQTVASWLRRHVEEPLDDEVGQFLADAAVPQLRWAAARKALLGVRLGSQPATRCWLLRPAASASLWQHMRHARLTRRLAVFVLAYAGTAVASAGAWWLIGAAALEGRFDPGTLLAWSFLLLSLVPLGLFAMWSQGVVMVGVSGILKMQLLAGALKLDPDETRHQGVGQHLARVMESGSLESLALTGGFYALTGVFDLILAATVLMTTSRTMHLGVLVATVIAMAALAVIYFRRRTTWTVARLRLTHDLVERMVGHRTRLVQEPFGASHHEEDEALSRYHELSRRMDRASVTLTTIPRLWLLLGLVAMAPLIVAPDTTPNSLALGIGTTLLVSAALTKMTASLAALVDAGVSGQQVGPLLEALRRPEPQGHVDVTAAAVPGTRLPSRSPLVAAHDLAFRFTDRVEPVLKDCGFRISVGDRVHLSGASGGGKSTLVSLLTGLREPSSGLLLLDGLDRATLGTKGWRKRVAAAPQFYENHLFTDTLAFNLLMGRRWPPTSDDLQLAETVCARLGLGDVIRRMPAGLFQVVGETGWQLSHGERSRVYMARALLQGADLVVLDESFAELDPDSLLRCLPQAADLARTLVVVAHA